MSRQVLGSAYPWIARRLLTDPSPELRVALRRLLYADHGEGGAFRFDRLESLLRQVGGEGRGGAVAARTTPRRWRSARMMVCSAGERGTATDGIL